MFKNAKVGDKVWSVGQGRGEIVDLDGTVYGVKVSFPKAGLMAFTHDGKYLSDDLNPTLFWDEVKIVPPPAPARLMTQAEYLADPSRCPYCRSTSIHGDTVEISAGGSATQAIDCSDCQGSWTATYKLTGYEEGTD